MKRIVAAVTAAVVVVAALLFTGPTAQASGRVAWTESTNITSFAANTETNAVIAFAAPSSNRDAQGLIVCNTNAVPIGVRFSNLFSTNQAADVVVPANTVLPIPFNEGYNVAISTRAITSNANFKTLLFRYGN